MTKLIVLFLVSLPCFAAPSETLNALIKEDWAYRLREYPEMNTYTGESKGNDRWTDLSPEAIARRKQHDKHMVARIKAIPRAELSPKDQLTFDLFLHDYEDSVASDRFPSELLQITPLDGFFREGPELLQLMPTGTKAQYEDILARMNGMPKHIEQIIALLEEGASKGVTPAKVTLRDVPEQIEKVIKGGTMLDPFKNAPEETKARASKVLAEKVVPAFTKLRTYLVDSYIPHCRETTAWSSLPQGSDWYAYLARHYTTTDLTPKKIHELGLSEVKRIRGEMDAVIKETGFNGSMEEFKKFLRTDSRFFFDSAGELVSAYRDIAKRIDPKLPTLFGKLPRLTYGVSPVPAFSEKSQTTAYYMPGSPRAGRAGVFYANTYDLKMRPKWEMEALTLHEAVPGHHLQIALAQENEDMPEFRRNSLFTVFVEGWGLYAESLGKEIGLYTDPYSHFGQLTYEMWRAIRLVVDTGMHALGWSRDQAIEYFKSNSSKTEHDIVVEIDRYIVMPGQALAYKMGELKIKEMRALAMKTLGEKFDVREFHDVVLRNGAVPLSVLETQVKDWLKRKRARKST